MPTLRRILLKLFSKLLGATVSRNFLDAMISPHFYLVMAGISFGAFTILAYARASGVGWAFSCATAYLVCWLQAKHVKLLTKLNSDILTSRMLNHRSTRYYTVSNGTIKLDAPPGPLPDGFYSLCKLDDK